MPANVSPKNGRREDAQEGPCSVMRGLSGRKNWERRSEGDGGDMRAAQNSLVVFRSLGRMELGAGVGSASSMRSVILRERIRETSRGFRQICAQVVRT